MKRWIGLLILALLLTGCTSQDPTSSTILTNPPTTNAPAEPSGTQSTVPPTLPDPVPDVLSMWYVELDSQYEAVAPMGDDLLLFGDGTLTRIDPDDGSVIASLDRSIPLPGSGLLQTPDSGVAYYDAADNALVVLDGDLAELSRTKLSENMTGDPYLAPDGKTLYYCTGAGIRIWDRDSGISRSLKIQEGNWLGISGTLFDGLWLRCQLQQEDGTLRTLLISTENGETIAEGDELANLTASGDYYCCLTESEWIFGLTDQRPHNLLVPDAIALPQIGAAVTVTPDENGLQLDHYDLATGAHTASEHIPEATGALCLTPYQGNLIFLSGDRLYTWCYSVSPELHPPEDDTVYTAARYTFDDPDLEGLAACQSRAEELGQLYGIDILLWQDITAAAPEGYTFGMEYRTAVYQQGLDALETALTQFPEDFLQNAASWTGDGTLHIVLVKSVANPHGVCTAVDGAQYLLGKNAYIALELGDGLEQAFYHTLAHVVDTYVLSNSAKFYEWNKLNPSGFSYDNNYTSHQDRQSKYLEGSSRYFVNSFAMSYPVEDRATLLEYAMIPGNDALFESKYMQAKLKRITQGLRDAFDLENITYPWEQYLN